MADASASGADREPRAEPIVAGFMLLSYMCVLYALRGFGSGLHAIPSLIGNGFLLIAGIFGCGLLARLVEPRPLKDRSELLLVLLVYLFSLVPTACLLYLARHFSTPGDWLDTAVVFLLPLSLAPLLATVLVEQKVGMVLGVWVSFATSIADNRSCEILLTGLMVTVVAVYLGRDLRRRSTVFKIGLTVTFSEAFFVVGKTLTLPQLADANAVTFMLQLAACVCNGLFTSVIVLLALPMFEAIFKVTTDIKLLELSDLGHPLLQNLAIEAPGTYHHSLVVANLAQAAAAEIGANCLFARVGAYYHDIGKLTKPELFVENIRHRANPHDALSPSMSSLVIKSHVKEGISMAMLYGLPPAILDVIAQHHGTGMVRYFHHKALQQVSPESAPDGGGARAVSESDFRYPGPRPRSRETAIISLADAVEAASRSLEKPTPGHMEALVDGIVNSKILDGQLDACGLTLSEIGSIRRSFAFTLVNMFHSRIPYPPNENRRQ